MSQPEIIETPVNAPYWAALREGRLDYQHCADCQHDWLPARESCPACLSPNTLWLKASGKAKLVSFVVYHKAYAPHLGDKVPYNVAIVELDEGPRLLSNIEGEAGHAGWHEGMRLHFRIGESCGRAIPVFCP